MLRNFLFLVFITVGLALARWLLKDVVRAVTQALGRSRSSSAEETNSESTAASDAAAGRMVRDPISGTYVDEKLAIREIINGEVFYFESRETRDTYLKRDRS